MAAMWGSAEEQSYWPLYLSHALHHNLQLQPQLQPQMRPPPHLLGPPPRMPLRPPQPLLDFRLQPPVRRIPPPQPVLNARFSQPPPPIRLLRQPRPLLDLAVNNGPAVTAPAPAPEVTASKSSAATATEAAPPVTPVMILRRPSSSPGQLSASARPGKATKTLKQREEEYAKARLRILGTAHDEEGQAELTQGDVVENSNDVVKDGLDEKNGGVMGTDDLAGNGAEEALQSFVGSKSDVGIREINEEESEEKDRCDMVEKIENIQLSDDGVESKDVEEEIGDESESREDKIERDVGKSNDSESDDGGINLVCHLSKGDSMS